MKTIKEAAGITGITEQNIRYYERQRLLCPERNRVNAYREYSEADIRRLKLISLFRRLDMPIAEIRKLFEGEISLEEAVDLQISRLESEKDRLDAALEFCRTIHESLLEEMDVEENKKEMEEKEKRGSVFAQFTKDYMAFSRFERKREFSFMPDTRCSKPEEFTDELLKFAKEEKLDMVITKEGMSPRFEIDGIEYRAYRTSGRFGIVVHCEMTHPEDYMPEGMSEKKYRGYRFLSIVLGPVLIFLTTNLWLLRSLFNQWETMLAFGAAAVVWVAYLYFVYYCYGMNFRG